MLDLPSELQTCIFSSLEQLSLLRLEQTSKCLNQLLKAPQVPSPNQDFSFRCAPVPAQVAVTQAPGVRSTSSRLVMYQLQRKQAAMVSATVCWDRAHG